MAPIELYRQRQFLITQGDKGRNIVIGYTRGKNTVELITTVVISIHKDSIDDLVEALLRSREDLEELRNAARFISVEKRKSHRRLPLGDATNKRNRSRNKETEAQEAAQEAKAGGLSLLPRTGSPDNKL